MFDKQQYRHDNANLDAAILEAGGEVKGLTVKCPFHDDQHPSASKHRDNDGVWRVTCHGCGFSGDVFDVLAKAKNTTAGEILKQLCSKTRPTKAKPEPASVSFDDLCRYWTKQSGGTLGRVWDCRDYGGEPWARLVRFRRPDGSKTDRWCRPTQGTFEGFYLPEAPPKPWCLYGWQSIDSADTVVVVEGQGCVDDLRKFGFAAVTGMGGSKNAHSNDWSKLAGKNVIIWRDNDEPGERYAADVESILGNLQPAARVTFIEPGDAELTGPGEDVCDFVEQCNILGHGHEEINQAIQAVLNRAKTKGPADGVRQRIEQAISGELRTVDWPWGCVDRLTKALQPGTVTLLCGNAGAGKSFALLEAAAHWHEQGERVVIKMLEEGQDYHCQRVLAQRAGLSGLTDFEFIRQHGDISQRAIRDHQGFINSFGSCIEASDDDCPSLEQLSKWIEAKAAAGYRIIAIDPLTAAQRTGDAWIVDGRFMAAVKDAIKHRNCSVVLITHPVKAYSGPDMNQLAGSAAYTRFSQTVLWLEAHKPKEHPVAYPTGTTTVEHNRTLHILKTRNGRGQGLKIAMHFDGDTLRLRDEGVITKQ